MVTDDWEERTRQAWLAINHVLSLSLAISFTLHDS